MRSTHLLRVAACLWVLVPALAGAAGSLSGALQSQVRKATFEIVMKKPEVDSLTYEKPLPLDLLPFKDRNDPYISIGSAFAIGDNRFVSAAHVFARGVSSMYGEPAVRQSDGSVHPISRIHKFSTLRDYVEFSCDSCNRGVAMRINREPAIDAEVFAVGNAHGEGIIIRDGLLTSMTPEQRYGKWKWLRFSAAASPGNSGGPLLDSQGRVLGIVLRKSESENLNYALPIAELLDAPQTGELETETRYWLPFLSEPVSAQREQTIPVPMTYSQLADEAMSFSDKVTDELHKELLAKNADTLFPRGEGSARLLQSSFQLAGLAIIARKEDRTWDAFEGEKPNNVQLSDNGYVSTTQFARFLVFKLRRPDSSDAQQFYSDSAVFMDTLLKAWPWKRTVGREQVRITSMGKAKQDSVYTDSYGRKWQIRSWDAEFYDTVVTSMALPTPDGYVGILTQGGRSQSYDIQVDLQSTADFVHLSPSGTLAQWKDYLARKDLLPKAIEDSKFEFEFGKRLAIQSSKFSFAYDNSQMRIQPDSRLTLTLNYVPSGNAFAWEVTGLTAVEDAVGDTAVSMVRTSRPPPSLPQEYSVEWQKVVKRQQPYDARLQDDDGVSVVTAIVPYPAPRQAATEPQVLYSITIARTGAFKEKEMQTQLKKWSAGVQVFE